MALDAARQSITLVQNGAHLPWTAADLRDKTVAIVGPSANLSDAFLGDYRPAACPGPAMKAPEGTDRCKKTALEVLSQRITSAGGRVTFAQGCTDGPPCSSVDLRGLGVALNGADLVVVIQGEKTTDNDDYGNTAGEGYDRKSIGLPGLQANVTAATIETGLPTVLVILSGGAVTIGNAPDWQDSTLLYAGFGGESSPEAIADVIFGDYNPSGRLPFTVYPDVWAQQTEMEVRAWTAFSHVCKYFQYPPPPTHTQRPLSRLELVSPKTQL